MSKSSAAGKPYARLLTAGASDEPEVRSVRAFSLTVARNVAFDWLRHKQVVPIELVADMEAMDILDERDQIDAIVNSHQELMMLVKAVQQLPERCRQVFTLRKVYGYSQKEIAARMNISENTVEQQLIKAARHCAAAPRCSINRSPSGTRPCSNVSDAGPSRPRHMTEPNSLPGSGKAEVPTDAAEWLVRLDGQSSPENWEAFVKWTESDKRHQAAFVRLRTAWTQFDRLKQFRPADGRVDCNALDDVSTSGAHPVVTILPQEAMRGPQYIDRKRWLFYVGAYGAATAGVGMLGWLER